MLLIITWGHLSPKVLIISAVCGRAPPAILPPYAPPLPPLAPAIDHDWLSVIKTLAFSTSEAALCFSCGKEGEPSHKKVQTPASNTDGYIFMSDPPATKKFRMLGNPGGTAIILSAGTMFN